ncbi:hypothetical protein [Vibrio sp. 03-59-1]|uniref:hypothetical protein n=1 Tax=Vibrio sp. 03-59-1 TaxID=2607607 RepID=UPI0020A49004|nr:hypothetical protein [Vibrio sp. 03-59-1]
MPLARIEEWKGRIIAYFGGGGIAAYSDQVAAKAQEAAHVATNQEIFTAQLFSGVGLLFVGCRLIFDIVVFIDKCRQRRKEKKAHG